MPGGGSKWPSERMLILPLPTNTSKIHLHVEQFSQKITGNWQKISYTTKDERKIFMKPGRMGRKMHQNRTSAPWRDV